MLFKRFLIMLTITIGLAFTHDAMPNFMGDIKDIFLIIILISSVYTFRVAIQQPEKKKK
jgi:cytochrome bd-type quinol oxidase subunit 2